MREVRGEVFGDGGPAVAGVAEAMKEDEGGRMAREIGGWEGDDGAKCACDGG